MKSIFSIAGIMILVLGLQTAKAQNIDTKKSNVKFSISNMKFNTVEGSFTGMQGEVKFDSNDLKSSSMQVCISSASVNTGNTKRDEHLRAEDFFDSKTYPDICFKSKQIIKQKNAYTVTGFLSLHGVTKMVQIPFSYSNKTFKGTLKINRIDFGVGDKGTFMVGDEVDLTITCTIL